jgi:POT family proton-dependent oligopeptide transporter
MTQDPTSEFASPAATAVAGGIHPAPVAPGGPTFFGHPLGLSTLFFTEMWERFSYYGMRALLLLFMTAPLAAGGLGWDTAKAGPIYGLYTALVYLTALPGGWIADRLIGQRRAVLFGGIIIACGHLSLTFHSLASFYFGLFLIVVGTGLLKPNISTMVGSLYGPDDPRRDAGFSIFYMGINIGAFLAPLVCGFLAQSDRFKSFLSGMGVSPESSWHWGFGAATVGMTLGVIQYALGGRRLGQAGLRPARSGDPAEEAADRRQKRNFLVAVGVFVVLAALLFALETTGALTITASGVTSAVGYVLVIIPFVYFIYLFRTPGFTSVERKRMGAIFLFFIFASLFWSAFEQAGSTLNLFADRFTRTTVLGFHYPSSWFQSVNSMFLWLLAPVFAWLWLTLGRRQPSSPAKFAYGLFFVGLGFLVIAFGAMASGPKGGLVSPMWLIAVYLLHTIGELCLSPVGLSTMTKLAPVRVTSQMMGIWFLASSVGNYVGGRVAGLFEKLPLPNLFGAVFGVCMLFTLIAIVLVKPMRNLMGGVR